MTPSLHRLLAGYLPINLIQAGAALGMVVIFSRLLDPAEYGRYALVATAVLWAQSLLFFWLQASVTRFHEHSRDRNELPRLLATVYSSALGLVVVLGLAGLLLARHVGDHAPLILAGLAALLPRALLVISLESHRAAHRVRRYSLLEGLQYLLALALGTLFVTRLDWGASGPLLGLGLANLIVLLLDTPFLIRQLIGARPAWAELRSLAGYGLPLTLSFTLGLVTANSDRFFIGWLMDEQAVGVYAVAYALADRPLSILFSWTGAAAVPLAFSALNEGGTAAARAVMATTARSLILIALPGALGLALVATPLAAVMVGEEFRAATTHIVPWVAVAGLLNGIMSHYTAHAFLITQHTQLLMLTTGLAALANVLLNLLLIPHWGLDGAIAATLAAYALGVVARVLLMRKRFPIPLVPVDLGKGLLACAGMAAVLLAVHWPLDGWGLLGAIGAGMLSYALAAVTLDVSGARQFLIARWQRWHS